MIARKHFPAVERLARISLLRGGVEGQRTVAELAAQLRNEAAADGQASPELRALGHDQAVSLAGMLRRTRVSKEPDVGGPTPESRRRKRRDTIGALHKAGTLGSIQVMAAEEIYAAYLLIVADSVMTQFRYEPPTDRSPSPDWTTGQIARVHRYWRWCDEMVARALPVAAVLTTLVDGCTLRDVERAHHMTNGTMTAILGDALSIYAQLAGWVRRGENRTQLTTADT